MTPQQFISHVQRSHPAPAYLFVGPERYQRTACRRALLAAMLGPGEENGFVPHDLDEVSLAQVLDDARSLSLFAARRVIWVASAEAALPRTRASAEEDGSERSPSKTGPKELLEAYMRSPSGDTVLVFDAARSGSGSEEKSMLDRVRKFYAAVPNHVEFERFSLDSARQIAESLARQAGLKIASPELALLVETLNADVARIAVEIEKLRLHTGGTRPLNREDIFMMVPDARAANIFALVASLGRGDRKQSLTLLDFLVREGEYLPLVLTFLATQFRLALVAKEARLNSASQIQGHFSRQGVQMWRSRAEQVAQTAAAFSKERLETLIRLIYETDKALRDANPDDRIVMEKFVLELAG